MDIKKIFGKAVETIKSPQGREEIINKAKEAATEAKVKGEGLIKDLKEKKEEFERKRIEEIEKREGDERGDK